MPEYIQPEKHKPSWAKKYFCPWIGQKYLAEEGTNIVLARKR